MKDRVISYKGFEILHRHCFNNVWFDAWKGQDKLNQKEIRMDNRDIDWDNPLTEKMKEFLVTS